VSKLHVGRLASRLLAAAVLGLILATPVLAAYLGDTYNPTPGGKTYGAGATITYGWHPDNPPPDWMRNAITAEINYLNDAAHMGANVPTLSGPVAAGKPMTVMFKYRGTDPCIEFACSYGKGSKSDNPDGYTVYFLADAAVAGSPSWRKYCQYNNATPSEYRSSCYDIRNITLHELGHVFGLGHFVEGLGPGASITVMQTQSRSSASSGWNEQDYGACDMARLQLVYDLNAASSKLSSCLTRQKTTLAFSKSATSVAYRGAVTFTATLTVTADGSGPNSSIFEGQKLSGRAVILERSTDGWATSTRYTMPAGASLGTYSMTINLTYTSQWRVRFATPSEGLSGVTSPASTITVAACHIAPCPS
jgi:hypothetical protein